MGRPAGSKNKVPPIERTRAMLAERRSRSRSTIAARSRSGSAASVAPPSRNASQARSRSRSNVGTAPVRRSGRLRSQRCKLLQRERNQILAEVRQRCTPGNGCPKYPKKSVIRELCAKANVGLGAAIHPTTQRIIHDMSSMMQFVEIQHLNALEFIKSTLTNDMKLHEPEEVAEGTVEDVIADAVSRRKLAGQQALTEAYKSEGYVQDVMWDRSLFFLYVAHQLKLYTTKIADLCVLYMRLLKRSDLADELTCCYKQAKETIDDFHYYLKDDDRGEIPIMTPQSRGFFERDNPLKDFIAAPPEEIITLDDDDL
uniref:RB_A domain-containing protein n=1 Tax=Panagrellus redivivus TaxID=6233 RepID=A0A7E4V7G9_PANRE